MDNNLREVGIFQIKQCEPNFEDDKGFNIQVYLTNDDAKLDSIDIDPMYGGEYLCQLSFDGVTDINSITSEQITNAIDDGYYFDESHYLASRIMDVVEGSMAYDYQMEENNGKL